MVCKKCNAQLAEDAQFCKNCGAKVEVENLQQKQVENPVMQGTEGRQQREKKPFPKVVVIGIVAAILVIGVLVKIVPSLMGMIRWSAHFLWMKRWIYQMAQEKHRICC